MVRAFAGLGLVMATLHEEIEAVLRANGNRWLTFDQVAAAVNQRGQFHRRDQEPLEGFQVRLRTLVSKNYAHKFEVIDAEQKVRLRVSGDDSV